MNYYFKNLAAFAVGLIVLSIAIQAQTTSPEAEPGVQDRVKQLESQVLMMQVELEKLKMSLAKNKEIAVQTEMVASAAESSKKAGGGKVAIARVD